MNADSKRLDEISDLVRTARCAPGVSGFARALSAFIGVHRRLTFFRYVRTDMNPRQASNSTADERR